MKKGPCLVIYDQENARRVPAVDFGTVPSGSVGQEIVVWLWNKKEFSDAPTATDVRITAVAGNRWSEEIVESKYLRIKSNGVMDPDGAGIVDDAESEYISIGGGLLDDGDFHRLGDIPTNCARRLFLKLEIPEGMESEGPLRLILQAGNMSEPVKWLYASP